MTFITTELCVTVEIFAHVSFYCHESFLFYDAGEEGIRSRFPATRDHSSGYTILVEHPPDVPPAWQNACRRWLDVLSLATRSIAPITRQRGVLSLTTLS